MLDRLNKKFLTGPDLMDNLAQFGIYPHKEDVYLWLKRYDRDADGRMAFTDFCDAFTPILDTSLAHILNQRQAHFSNKGCCKKTYFNP